MKWEQVDRYAVVSSCGRYSVCKVGGMNAVFRYSAWRSEKHPKGRLQLAANLPNAETAKTVCEGDK